MAYGMLHHDRKALRRKHRHPRRRQRSKVSKSIGNVLLVRDLLEEAPGEAVRMALISGHYRKPLDWTDETLPNAVRELDRLYTALRDVAEIAIEDDVAKARTFEIVRALNSATDSKDKAKLKAELLAACQLLGIGRHDPEAWLERRDVDEEDAEEINRLVAERNQARKNKDFATADRIRYELADRGVLLEDGPDGTKWRKMSPTTVPEEPGGANKDKRSLGDRSNGTA